MAGFDDIKRRLDRAFREAREAYRDLGRFQRLRIMIISFLVVDVIATGVFVFMLSLGDGSVAVSYRAEYETRLVVVRNRTRVLTNAQLVLDGKYRYPISRLEVGPHGIDLRDFRDPQGLPPDVHYRPQRALLITPQDHFDIVVGADEASGR